MGDPANVLPAPVGDYAASATAPHTASSPGPGRAPDGLLLEIERLIEGRVKAELERVLAEAVARALRERAGWWRAGLVSVRRNWQAVLALGVAAGVMTSWQDGRVSLHRRLLNFDETLALALHGSAMYSTGGTFVYQQGATGAERVWQLPFVAQRGQDVTVRYRVTYSDSSSPVPLRVRLVGADAARPINVQTIADESGSITKILSERMGGQAPPEDGVYTLVVEPKSQSRVGRTEVVKATFVVQIMNAPTHAGAGQ